MPIRLGTSLKPREKAEARRLRSVFGMPMKRIASLLDVSPGAVHEWTKDIELPPEFVARNKALCHDAATSAWRRMNRDRRQAAQDEGRALAKRRDPKHIAGCMLYWAEGAKDRNTLVFANSDLNMVRFFKGFLVECFGLGPDDFSMKLNVYLGNGLSLKEIEDHWLTRLDLPRSCLRKHVVDHFPTSSSGRKANRLPYGVCSLTALRSTPLVQHIFGAIQEYADFEEPRWLDGPPRKPRKPRKRGVPSTE